MKAKKGKWFLCACCKKGHPIKSQKFDAWGDLCVIAICTICFENVRYFRKFYKTKFTALELSLKIPSI